MRIGIVRESMLIPPGSKAAEPITTAAAREIKAVLGAQLGATLVESSDPLWQPDPDIERDEDRFPARAGAARAGFHARPPVPAGRRTASRSSGFRGGDRADRVRARQECSAPARCSRSTTASSWRTAASRRPSNLDISTVQQQELAMAFRFHVPQYLSAPRRGLAGARLHRDARRLAGA